jgi:hypothetical protein
MMATLFSPIYAVRLRPESSDGIRGLRRFLKTALRAYGLRCITVTTEQFESGPCLSRQTRRPDRFGNHQEIPMDSSDLAKLKRYAATTKSSMAFGGCPFIKWDYKNGKYQVGKNNTDFTGKRLVADLPDILGGFQKLEAKKKPEYVVVRVLGDIDPIERDELGECDKSTWVNDRDPWTAVTVLPLFDPETRQVYVFSATYSARDAAANLLEAFTDHSAAHPEAADQLPLIQLCVREYVRSDGNPGYAVAFDIVDWVERPKAVLHIHPPPLNITATETTKTNGKAASESAGEDSAESKSLAEDKGVKAKPKRKIAIPGTTDMDDEIPF